MKNKLSFSDSFDINKSTEMPSEIDGILGEIVTVDSNISTGTFDAVQLSYTEEFIAKSTEAIFEL